MVDYSSIDREVWTLTEEGQQVAEQGSHEARVFENVPTGEEGISIAELQVRTRQIFVIHAYIYIYKMINK